MFDPSENPFDLKSKTDNNSKFDKPHELSEIKHVIGVVSGKGGVGKSTITSLLAVLMQRMGYVTAIMDADMTGPSIPRAFGIKERADGSEIGLLPVSSEGGIPIMSVNLLLPDETEPVIWRGPILGGVVKQFWSNTIWGSVDFMFVDLPPGTGDVAITVYQSLPLDGIIMVTTPQSLVSMIVEKAVKMAKNMNVPLLGMVENMSYVACPDCGKKISIFGESRLEGTAKKFGISHTDQMPINPEITALIDNGKIEQIQGDLLPNITKLLRENY